MGPGVKPRDDNDGNGNGCAIWPYAASAEPVVPVDIQVRQFSVSIR
jgi:hypothetical protein